VALSWLRCVGVDLEERVMVDQIHATLSKLVVPIEGLVPYGKNPRRGDVDAIAESLTVNGQYKPIVVRAGSNEVLAGNHTLKAARQLGWDKIAVTFVDVDDDGAARIVLVDNRTNDMATYDEAALAELLSSLPDLTGTGYGAVDLDELLGTTPGLNDPDDTPEPPTEPLSVLGDVWVLGKHRVVCGDATDVTAYDALLGDERAACIWTDPPYGVEYVGKTKDALTIQNDGAVDLPELLEGAFFAAWSFARPGAAFYVAAPPGPLHMVFMDSLRERGYRQTIIWLKSSMVLGHSDYHYKHEPLFYGYVPGYEGRRGRGGDGWFGDNSQTSVLEFDKPGRNKDHPTMKPVALVGYCVGNSTKPGNLVLDPFGGSGSTLIACHDTNRVARLIELDPRYVDVICRRYQEHTGDKPVLESTGEPHDFTTKD